MAFGSRNGAGVGAGAGELTAVVQRREMVARKSAVVCMIFEMGEAQDC